MSAPRLRQALPWDLPALQNIEYQCFTSDRIAPRQMRYLLVQAKAVNLVVEADGVLAAYCCCLTPSSLRRPARLYSLAVLPTHQGQGLARMLLDQLIKGLHSRGYARLRLEVRAGDQRTITLYRQFGFRELMRSDAYYEDGESALRLELSL